MIICDKCGKPGNINHYQFGKWRDSNSLVVILELCPDCAKELREIVENFAKEEDDGKQAIQ